MRQAREYRGEIEDVPCGKWTILFKQLFKFEETTHACIRFSVEIPPSIQTEAAITVFLNSFKMRCINNDTREEVCACSTILYNTISAVFYYLVNV